MKKYRIITDGSADLPACILLENRISVVPFYLVFDEKTTKKQDVDITAPAFYAWMISHPDVFPKSSTPTPNDFFEAFEAAAKAGEDVLCICITSKFSGAYQIACLAKNMMQEQYPDTCVTVIDSAVNTVLQGQVVLEACRLRDAGMSLTEVVAGIEAIKPSGRIFFTIGGMEYLRIGGRIGKLAGRVGTLIGIRPIITLRDGEIFPSGASRSRRKTLDKVLSSAAEYIPTICKTAEELSITVGYGYDRAEAEAFADKVREMLAGIGFVCDVPLRQIGAVIGVHTGPHPLGLGIVRRAVTDRKNEE